MNESHSIGFCLLETKLSGLMLLLLCEGIFGFKGVQIMGLIGSSNFSSIDAFSRGTSRTGGCAGVGAEGSVISITDS